jgi:hypothetical protein
MTRNTVKYFILQLVINKIFETLLFLKAVLLLNSVAILKIFENFWPKISKIFINFMKIFLYKFVQKSDETMKIIPICYEITIANNCA